MATIIYAHIDIDDEGVATISGTRTKVVEIALDRLAYHWDADEIRRQHPHLTLAQIYAALTYYYDHQEPMEREIEQRLDKVRQIKSSLGPSPLQMRLKLKKDGRLRQSAS